MLSILVFFLLVSPAFGATITADGCTPRALQDAINRASSGDRVEVPPCTYDGTWSTVQIPKSIVLVGAGGDATALRRSSGDRVMFSVQGTTGFQMSGFWLRGETADAQGCVDASQPGSKGRNGTDTGLLLTKATRYQVFKNRFCNFRYGVTVVGDPAQAEPGVIFQNFFENIVVYEPCCHGYGVEVRGESAWPTAVDWGSPAWVFIEDNRFDVIRHAIECNDGGKYVARRNTITRPTENAGALDAHNQHSWKRGCRAVDAYNNDVRTTETTFTGFHLRGGDASIHDNDFGKTAKPVVVDAVTHCGDPYPAFDQIRDAYIWDNTPAGVSNRCPANLLLGRDYYLTPRPHYTQFPYPHPLRTGENPPEPKPQPVTLTECTIMQVGERWHLTCIMESKP